ncbi:hypothetical protein ACFLZP_01790 [Patescibacteria group bacterium]
MGKESLSSNQPEICFNFGGALFSTLTEKDITVMAQRLEASGVNSFSLVPVRGLDSLQDLEKFKRSGANVSFYEEAWNPPQNQRFWLAVVETNLVGPAKRLASWVQKQFKKKQGPQNDFPKDQPDLGAPILWDCFSPSQPDSKLFIRQLRKVYPQARLIAHHLDDAKDNLLETSRAMFYGGDLSRIKSEAQAKSLRFVFDPSHLVDLGPDKGISHPCQPTIRSPIHWQKIFLSLAEDKLIEVVDFRPRPEIIRGFLLGLSDYGGLPDGTGELAKLAETARNYPDIKCFRIEMVLPFSEQFPLGQPLDPIEIVSTISRVLLGH